MIRVAVTELEYEKGKFVFETVDGFECLPAPSDEGELAEFIRSEEIHYVIPGVGCYSGPLYKALPQGGVIARFGVGYDGLDLDLATAAGLFCTNTPNVLTNSVAEHTVALIQAAARRIVSEAWECKHGNWNPVIVADLQGKTLSIIGCGKIGRRVAQIAAFGFGMHVIGIECRKIEAAQLQNEYGFAQVVSGYDEGVSRADFVSIHIPGSEANRGFINRARLEPIPRHTWLINTARGVIIDEEALYHALAKHDIAGAALDVFVKEPYEPISPELDLRGLENVIMLPHIASSTREAIARMAHRALENIKLAVSGEFAKMDLLNPQILTSMGITA